MLPLAEEDEKDTEQHFVDLDGNYEADDAEVSLMLKNYRMFDHPEE